MRDEDLDVVRSLSACIAKMQATQKEEPCRERALAITKCQEAQMWLWYGKTRVTGDLGEKLEAFLGQPETEEGRPPHMPSMPLGRD